MIVELMKLIGILAFGAAVIGGGLYYQKKVKGVGGSESGLSDEEKQAKSYIETYKGSYTREQIKSGLSSFYRISDENAEAYLNKYYM